MLRKIAAGKRTEGGNFAIVAARYNPKYTDALVSAARAELRKGAATHIEVVRVPGSFEVPVVAATLAKRGFDAIICLGAIFQGATSHARNIADGVSVALANLQIKTGIPMIHGVLLFENEEQARVRCLGREHNRGTEAARTALEMAEVMRSLRKKFSRPGKLFSPADWTEAIATDPGE